jgi:hypothetical protein
MSYGLRVEGLNRLVRDLQLLGVSVDDLKAVFGEIADEGAHLAAGFAPHRTGRLAASVRGSRSKNRAVVRAGGVKTPYAGVINYGWPKRSIAASHFMQKASDTLKPTVGGKLQHAIEKLIAEKGLG